MVLTLLLFFIATFGMVAAGVIGYGFLVERRALSGEDRTAGGHDIGWVEPFDLLKSESFSTISFWDRVLSRVDYVEIMKVRIREAGLNWSVGRLTLLMLLLGTVAAVLIGNLRWASWMIAAAGGLSVAILPYLYVLRLRRKRLEKFESQFPDSLDSLARALRAGHPLAAGLQMLAMEGTEPLAGEMRTTVKERTLGMSWEQALDNLANRVPMVEVSTFVAAVKLQNRTGGKLNEVLSRLAETMRESSALKSEVRAISIHGKMTGRVLTLLPILIAVMMSVVNPGYLVIMWTKPAGQAMIAGAIVCLVAAHLIIGKLVDIRI